MLKRFSNIKLGLLAKVFGGAVILYFLYVFMVNCFSSTCKDPYTPPQIDAEFTDKDRAMVMADALTHSINQELDSFFGWIPNDVLIPSIFADNIISYQRGVIYGTRPASDVLAKTISRYGRNDTIDNRLVDATSRDFVYGANVWGFLYIYDCESKYKDGIKNWKSWAYSVDSGAKNSSIYNLKSDDNYQIVKYCSQMLEYCLGILNNDEMGHFDSDNNVYFTKGVVAVVNNVLIGLISVDNTVVERGGQENFDAALKQLEYVNNFNPMYIVAGGDPIGDAMLPNHVAALARHIDIASNRITDILTALEK